MVELGKMVVPEASIKKTENEAWYYFTCYCDEITYIATFEARHFRRRNRVYCCACGAKHIPVFTERHDCDKD